MAGNISNSNIWEDNNPKIQAQIEKVCFAEMKMGKRKKKLILLLVKLLLCQRSFCSVRRNKKVRASVCNYNFPYGENKMRDGYTILETCKS